MDVAIELLGGRQVCAERFLNDDARPTTFRRFVQSGRFQVFQDRLELLRRGREIEQPITARAAFLVGLLESFRERLVAFLVVELALMIKKRLGKRLPNFVPHRLTRKLFRCLGEIVAKLIIFFGPASETDDRNRWWKLTRGG